MNQYKNVDLEISKIKNLPPLPEESIRIISAVNDSDISVEELVEVLSLSPVLVARLLGMANSSYFGRSGQIDDLKIAIIQVLGLNLVKSLALSIVLNVELKTTQCKNFDSNYFWGHALITAIMANKFALKLRNELIAPNIAYTSGLLLNIGLLVSINIFPNELNKIFSKVDPIEGSVLNEMQYLIGKNQYQMGQLLLERWKLPLVYQEMLKQYRQKEYEDDKSQLVLLLELSHWVAVYIIMGKIDEMPDFSDLLNKLSLSKKVFSAVVNDVEQTKDSVFELATVISG